MSKNQVATAANQPTGLATQPGQLPSFLGEQQMTGIGIASDAKDFLIPMAKVLDAKSPEVTKGRPEYHPGAEAGDIFVKNAPMQLIKGEEGILSKAQ